MRYDVAKEKGGRWYVYPEGHPEQPVRESYTNYKKKALNNAASMCGLTIKKYLAERKKSMALPMTDNEIVRSYKEALEKKEQITILAQLNATTTSNIIEILKQSGEDIPYTRIRGKKKTETQEQFPQEETRTESTCPGSPTEREESLHVFFEKYKSKVLSMIEEGKRKLDLLQRTVEDINAILSELD